jgi:hypothetical protein
MTEHHRKEIDKRRTFGIISHPDAGKTTLTEKLLLYGGAIQLAGAVKARKAAPPKPRLVVENDGKEVALKKKTGAKTTQAKPKRQNKDNVGKKQENQIKLF